MRKSELKCLHYIYSHLLGFLHRHFYDETSSSLERVVIGWLAGLNWHNHRLDFRRFTANWTALCLLEVQKTSLIWICNGIESLESLEYRMEVPSRALKIELQFNNKKNIHFGSQRNKQYSISLPPKAWLRFPSRSAKQELCLFSTASVKFFYSFVRLPFDFIIIIISSTTNITQDVLEKLEIMFACGACY